MTERIEVGDLVIIVRVPRCCAVPKRLIYTVLGFEKDVFCMKCMTILNTSAARIDTTHAVPLSWLKRIPPLAELESTETTVKEPAC